MSDEQQNIPKHIAIIMDGNGRWAQKRGLPRVFGHRQGAETVRRVVEAAANAGVKYLTLFGFSTENWSRPAEEVSELMNLLRHYVRSNVADLQKNNVRLCVIGERERIEPDVLATIEQAEALTAKNDRITLTIAFSYGARQEIVLAMRKLAEDVQNGKLTPSEIDVSMVSGALLTADLPDPDLLIRTSGEQRISNFMLWQIAYSELVFVDTFWPDFGKDDLDLAIRTYQSRDRRFGGVKKVG